MTEGSTETMAQASYASENPTGPAWETLDDRTKHRWRLGAEVVMNLLRPLVDAAVLAEREACAKRAESYYIEGSAAGAGDAIAAAIRARSKP